MVVVGVGIVHSDDKALGLGVIETNLSLLLLPLLLSPQEVWDEKHLHGLLLTFVLGVCFGSSVCLINAIIQYSQAGLPTSFLYFQLTGFLDFQPTYYAYYLVFSITVVLFLLNSGKSPIWLTWMCFLILFLFVMLLLTGGRTSFISMLFVFSFFVLKFLLGTKSRVQWLSFGSVVLMMTGLFVITAWVGDSTSFSDSWDRYDLWKSALSANENPILGVGTGDYKTVLNSYFVAQKMSRYASENLNAHNQFIQTYLSNGVLGLIALILLISHPLYLAFRRDHSLTILALFPFIIYGMTEVFLGRYQGVVFFAFIHQVFVSYLSSIQINLRS